jgi:hypothetical protein
VPERNYWRSRLLAEVSSIDWLLESGDVAELGLGGPTPRTLQDGGERDSVLFPGALVGGAAGVFVAFAATRDDIDGGEQAVAYLLYGAAGTLIGILIDRAF